MQQVDDPPYLSVGTEVSAKYKGAFCEAKVRKVVRNIKCKVAYKQGLGTGTVSDDQIKCDLLRVGATVEVKHPDRREYVEATITKIQDYSQYTVVFDDGDITTLRRSALCLKSGRHFNESETLDQLPLTHPEHFGNPVIGGRRGRSLELYKKNIVRSRHTPDESSDEDEEVETKPRIIEKEEHIGKIVCVESTDTKKKGPKENWFPALVVAPTAQDTVRIRVKDEYLVRSFKDGRYYTVPKKEATEFTGEQASKQDTVAVQAALEYMHNDCLPAHWDREVLFGLGNSLSDFYNEFDSDTSDDEPTEEKDHFVAQLYKYMDDRGTPLNKGPSIINKDVDLYRLYRAVQKLGGYNRVTTQNQWKQIAIRLGFVPTTTSIQNLVKQAYKKFLLPFEEFDRKLGCTMVAHPRANRIKGRSLVRANSVASPKPEKESKSTTSAAEESENTSESGVDTAKPKTKSKVKSLIDQYEEKMDDAKCEQKDLKDKEVKIPKETGRELRDKESIPSTSVKSLDILGNRKDKSIRRQIVSSADEKRGKKRIVKENENEKIKCDPYEKEKGETIDVPINVGDKLRVYYHEQKVTYEAKVIEISKDENALYLVHYTGWNTRYDEWVPKERIAENLTNNKSNKRLKSGNKAETRSHSSTSDKIAGPSPLIRSSSKRNRVGSKNDIDQHPRSTTPSSIASNSSRTKSPATPAQHRRTTRGQPNKLRRTSNNTDISSLQTDSDSDSDEPVVKKPTPKRRPVTTKIKSRRLNAIEMSEEIKKEKYSNASSEEEPLANAVAKNKELQLSQISSELKGFNEVKKVSSDTPSTSTHTLLEKKIDYIPKSEPRSPSSSAQSSHQISGANKSISGIKTKFKTENSSDSDSFGDDDSSHLEICKTSEMASDKSANSELIEKVATLKQSGIEKIIKTTLAEKPKGLPEKPSMRTLIERTPLKHLDGDKQTEVSENYPERVLFPMKCNKNIGSEQKDIEKSSTKDNDEQIMKVESDDHILTESTRVQGSIDSGYDKTATIGSCPSTSSVISKNDIDDPIVISSSIKVESCDTPFTKIEKQKALNKSIKSSVIISKDNSNSDDDSVTQESTVGDIYEFKEPEPFEFEASKKTSPETDKKPKRKGQIEKSELTKRCPTPPVKRTKKSVNKDVEKDFQLKTEDDSEQSNMLETIPTSDPIKTEPDFEEPELSHNMVDDESSLSDDKKSDKEDAASPSTTIGAIASSSETGREIQPAIKSLFINTFVEATIEDQSKVFELKATKYTKSKVGSDEDLESVKKIMLTDEVLNQEPPKIDKPSSIADKVLKALSSQQNSISSPETSAVESENLEADANQSHISTNSPSERSSSPSIASTAIESSSSTNSELISKSQRTTPLTTRVLDNEVQSSMKSVSNKIDILESISPKNNDLSETIQKLESVIQKTGDQSHMSDDSTDSTDSEQRLIIEDESQSLETTPENEMDADVKQAHKDAKLIVTSKTTTSTAVITLVSNTGDLAPNTVNISGTEKQEIVNQSAIEPLACTKGIETTDSKKCNKSDITEDHAIDVKLDDNNDIQNDESEVVQNESLSLFLCEETIPGSPAPACPKEQNETSKKGYDNLFTSPSAIESDARLVSIETETKHVQKTGEKSATPASSPRDSMSQDESSEDINKKQEQDRIISPKKRRCTRKQSELESISKRRKPIPRRNTITGSDSEDNSDMNATQRVQRPSKTCQYNFLVQLDPAMNSNQRIALLKKKIQDLRKTYNMIKTELASIDRRRKKLRRREREMKKNAQQNQQSQQSTDQPSSTNQHAQNVSQNQQSETRASVQQS